MREHRPIKKEYEMKYSTDIQMFDFHNHEVRVLTDNNGEPWFVGKDVASILGYANASKALADHVDDEDKLNNESLSSLGQRGGWLINESGLYSLVFASKLAYAKEFKRWVTSEVLPSIRKHGGYLVGQEKMTPEEMVAASMRYLESKIAEQRKQLEEQAPKVLFADTVSGAANSITVGVLAKILKQKGVPDMGQNRLFTKLRDDGFLCKQHGENWNMPTQYAMERGLFNVKERTVANPDGSVRVTRTTMVTGRGQIFFVNKYANQPVTAE